LLPKSSGGAFLLASSLAEGFGRAGIGAVMGSKKLKAVVVKGDMQPTVADIEEANKLRQENIAEGKQFLERFRQYGTGGHADVSAHSGDTPVKNWGGVGIVEIPDVSGLNKENVIANLDKRKSCWHCPAACKASLKEGKGEYKYPAGNHRLEYETLGAFGANCCVTNVEAIAMASHICNSNGIDTISTGTIVAFAMECYENGIITKNDTDGIELTFGNERAMVAMTEKIAKREGIGDILADGVKIAAEKIGKGAEEFAVHIGGQELGMHDPKLPGRHFPGMASAAMYKMDATPGRHTTGFGPSIFMHCVMNSAGLCMSNGMAGSPQKYIPGFMRAVTGWDVTLEELLKTGERIATMRHVFTLREGVNPLERYVHPRIIGQPAQTEGPLAGITADIEAETWWNLGALDWDRVTTKPSRQKLLKLGMDDIADELWPPGQQGPGFGPP
jgi:aldehyde:ferredoxin oxidoreductase